ncbi:MAG: hypothetical protein ING25_07245 [Burkholderiales bacterium]|nr:hypothetical protein [Burkholderiales bacterium]
MTKITLSGGKVSPQPHAAALDNLKSLVTEYVLSQTQGERHFNAWNPFGFTPRDGQTQALLDKVKAVRPEGGSAVVALHDPVGMAAELAMLMKHRMDVLAQHPELQRNSTLSGLIQSFQDAVRTAVERDNCAASEELAQRAEQGVATPVSLGAPDPATIDLKAAQRYRQLTATELQQWGNQHLKKYWDKYDEPTRQKWQQAYDQQLANFDRDFIIPLAQAHAKLMQTDALRSYFETNFDPLDPAQGVIYTQVFNLCIVSTQDKGACYQVLENWILDEQPGTNNLLFKALTSNQAVAQKVLIQAVQASSTQWGGLPWDKLIQSFEQATQAVVEGRSDALARLVGSISGPVGGALKRATESRRVYTVLAAVGVAQRQPIHEVKLSGTQRAFRQAVTRQLLQQSGAKLDAKALERYVRGELKRLEVYGVKLDGQVHKTWLVCIDPQDLRGMPKGLNYQQQGQWLVQHIKTPQDLERLQLHRWQAKVQTATARVSAAVNTPGARSTALTGFAALGLIANSVALTSMLDEDAKVLHKDKPDMARRLWAQAAQVLGAAAATLEAGLAQLGVGVMQGVRSVQTFWMKILGQAARWLGAGGSLVLGVLDWKASISKFGEQDRAGGWAYVVSGTLGIAATIFLLLRLNLLGLIAVIVLVAWTLLGPQAEDKWQDWLERLPPWGKLKAQHYPSLDAALKDFEQANRA